jgi:hypothetical protein
MSTHEILESLKTLSNQDRLRVIQTATQLNEKDQVNSLHNSRKQEEDEKIHEAALRVKHLYEPGAELTEWTVLDAEDFLDEPTNR